jgi:hypothetical protein
MSGGKSIAISVIKSSQLLYGRLVIWTRLEVIFLHIQSDQYGILAAACEQ